MKQLPIDRLSTVLACLDHYAQATPDALAYTYLSNGADESLTVDYRTLHANARQYGGWLVEMGYQGRAILLMFPSGIEFVTAFLACMYAGAYAVPTNVPRRSHHFERLQQIIRDAQATAVLTSAELEPLMKAGLQANGQDIPVFCQAQVPQGDFSAMLGGVGSEDIAFLQYTSGSTGNPKGVVVTHGNLVANERAIRACAKLPEQQVCCTWLPQFHDMGLIGTTLQPLALGGHVIAMSPLHFVQRPMRWLRAISRYSAVVSATPNFGLDLCTKAEWTAEDAELDLSSLQTIFCGAEPVRKASVDAFIRRFETLGLKPSAVKPCYGMAETTLIVSGVGAAGSVGHFLPVNPERLEAGAIVEQSDAELRIASCGAVVDDHQVRIVAPESCTPLPDDRVGEIWVSGPSVARGYWQNEPLTQQMFQARTSDGQGPFCRTGDLGFMRNGNLYITGRIKDLIIVRGRNIYPHDIEQHLIECLSQHGHVTAAVFAFEQANGQQIGAYIELPRGPAVESSAQMASLIPVLKQDILVRHDIDVSKMAFVSSGAIPKTSSGKIQRSKCGHLMCNDAMDPKAIVAMA